MPWPQEQRQSKARVVWHLHGPPVRVGQRVLPVAADLVEVVATGATARHAHDDAIEALGRAVVSRGIPGAAPRVEPADAPVEGDVRPRHAQHGLDNAVLAGCALVMVPGRLPFSNVGQLPPVGAFGGASLDDSLHQLHGGSVFGVHRRILRPHVSAQLQPNHRLAACCVAAAGPAGLFPHADRRVGEALPHLEGRGGPCAASPDNQHAHGVGEALPLGGGRGRA
mmetsp:Transcript_76322/g.210670  ORF Transcript_76322/g.210670 Transcript_76322/m.210670 type:complete len:224 (-) Transcript_76322:13-684(-)